MSAHRISFRWSREAQGDPLKAANSLQERLREVSEDRAAEAQDVVRETAGLLRAWVLERPHSWTPSPEVAGAELEGGWAQWLEQQAWRGSCANFVQAVRQRFAALRGGELREGLAEELTRWMTAGPAAGAGPLPNPGGLAPHALGQLERADEILVHGRSAAIVESLIAAQRAGLCPKVTLGLGSADQSGQRSARELAGHGVAVRLIWDAALPNAVREVDRVWLATEGVGAGAFLSWLGSRALLDEARRQEIPVHVLCTSDACLPGGQLERPAWGDTETWNLWSLGPRGVQLEAQPFEITGAEGVTRWITEEGTTDLATLCTRHLDPEPAAACNSPLATEHRPPSVDAREGHHAIQ